MKQKNKKADFIVFEGLDGSGQSTQAENLFEFLKKRGDKVYLTKEPTNGIIGGLIRGQLKKEWKSSPECLQLLFAADRAHHQEKEISLLLESGVTVISDRYFFSSIAFGFLEIDDWNWLKEINKKFILPDKVFFLDVSPKTCIDRIKKNRINTELFEDEKKLEKVYLNYKRIIKEFDSFEVIDGSESIDKVSSSIEKFF